MPFGLTNAPSVFQRLMQKVLAGLNPEGGPDFVVVYIDDILVFSRTLEEHLEHLRRVIERLEEAQLKLKLVKCQFIRKEVDYLGHVLTPEGLKVNSRLVEAVTNFPQPQNVSEVCRFLGLASYYRRFVPQFSKIAQPLRAMTCKGATFAWTTEAQAAMQQLKERLTNAPVLDYPSFGKPFTLETDTSINGIGAVLSQEQDDCRLHPIAYASRLLSSAERNYSITELETLAVVWAVTHFHSYLYGHSVTILTDHTAVKAVLETPNPSMPRGGPRSMAEGSKISTSCTALGGSMPLPMLSPGAHNQKSQTKEWPNKRCRWPLYKLNSLPLPFNRYCRVHPSPAANRPLPQNSEKIRKFWRL
jgi:hypothetical protein